MMATDRPDLRSGRGLAIVLFAVCVLAAPAVPAVIISSPQIAHAFGFARVHDGVVVRSRPVNARTVWALGEGRVVHTECAGAEYRVRWSGGVDVVRHCWSDVDVSAKANPWLTDPITGQVARSSYDGWMRAGDSIKVVEPIRGEGVPAWQIDARGLFGDLLRALLFAALAVASAWGGWRRLKRRGDHAVASFSLSRWGEPPEPFEDVFVDAQPSFVVVEHPPPEPQFANVQAEAVAGFSGEADDGDGIDGGAAEVDDRLEHDVNDIVVSTTAAESPAVVELEPVLEPAETVEQPSKPKRKTEAPTAKAELQPEQKPELKTEPVPEPVPDPVPGPESEVTQPPEPEPEPELESKATEPPEPEPEPEPESEVTQPPEPEPVPSAPEADTDVRSPDDQAEPPSSPKPKPKARANAKKQAEPPPEPEPEPHIEMQTPDDQAEPPTKPKPKPKPKAKRQPEPMAKVTKNPNAKTAASS